MFFFFCFFEMDFLRFSYGVCCGFFRVFYGFYLFLLLRGRCLMLDKASWMLKI